MAANCRPSAEHEGPLRRAGPDTGRDHHAQDQEALQLYWSYIKLAKEGREKYQKMYGPLLQTDLTPEDGFAWLKDPWPWEEGGND